MSHSTPGVILETHPFSPFVPKDAKYLLLGSFTGRSEPGYDWYYATKRNQFWPILEQVYCLKLDTNKSKQHLFNRLKLAVTDLIYQCARVQNNNSDTNLKKYVYNLPAIEKIFSRHRIETVYFSSRFAENKFKRLFKNITNRQITLPSPSPRYAKLSLKEKIKIYSRLLPKVKHPDNW